MTFKAAFKPGALSNSSPLILPSLLASYNSIAFAAAVAGLYGGAIIRGGIPSAALREALTSEFLFYASRRSIRVSYRDRK